MKRADALAAPRGGAGHRLRRDRARRRGGPAARGAGRSRVARRPRRSGTAGREARRSRRGDAAPGQRLAAAPVRRRGRQDPRARARSTASSRPCSRRSFVAWRADLAADPAFIAARQARGSTGSSPIAARSRPRSPTAPHAGHGSATRWCRCGVRCRGTRRSRRSCTRSIAISGRPTSPPPRGRHRSPARAGQAELRGLDCLRALPQARRRLLEDHAPRPGLEDPGRRRQAVRL